MGVKFTSFGGGASVATQITDSFQGPTGPLSQNWAQGSIANTPFANPNYQTSHSLFLAPDAIQAMGIQSSGTGIPGQLTYGYLCPVSLIAGVYGKSQFIQATLVGDTTAGSAAFGIGVLIKPTALPNGYILAANRGSPSCVLSRFAPNGNNQPGTSLNLATLVAPVNANSTPIGTAIRVSVDLSTPSAPIITVKFNGSQVAQFTDNVAPLAGGLPGFLSQMGGGNYFFRNCTAGLGL